MASFPTTAITYANRSAGQTIASAHMNSVQDEIAAIEAGYLDGGARLNSSNSTVANLSVAGGSTFTGSALFSSAITVSTKVIPGSTATMIGDSTTAFKEVHCSSLYVGGVSLTALSPPARVKVTHSAATAYGAATGLNWDTDEYNPNGMHSTSANSSRITFADSTGVYHVGACITSTSPGASTDAVQITIVLNDSTTFVASQLIPAGQRAVNVLNVSGDLRAGSTTDYVTVQVRGLGGAQSTGTVAANSTSGPTAFWAHRVST